MDLGLGYLALDRAAATLSTGERQRMQLARAVRNRTTGVLYVLDEPSIGLHPSNLVGLAGVMRDLVADGNSVVLVDHDAQVLSGTDWIIEMGPGAGADGGTVIAQGAPGALARNPRSKIGPFLGGAPGPARPRAAGDPFAEGRIRLATGAIHTVQPLEADFPKGRLTVVTGVSGSGKTTLVLESLVPALAAAAQGGRLPDHVRSIDAPGIAQVKLIDATPNWHQRPLHRRHLRQRPRRAAQDLRPHARRQGARLCRRRFLLQHRQAALPRLRRHRHDQPGRAVSARRRHSLPRLPRRALWQGRRQGALAGQVRALVHAAGIDGDGRAHRAGNLRRHEARLPSGCKVLADLGLGYLTLGEETPSLSGGEAQRLKLASEMGRSQADSVFVFDEPTIGLHPLDVRTLLGVFQTLIDHGATVVVIEHDLDVIRSADYIVDMGPEGGAAGGRIVASGTPEDIRPLP